MACKEVFLFSCFILVGFFSVGGRNVEGNIKNVSEDDDDKANVWSQKRSVFNSSEIVFDDFAQEKDELETGQVVSQLISSLCSQDVTQTTPSEGKQSAAGCVMGSLIPRDKTYLVNFWIFGLLTKKQMVAI